MGVWHSGSDCIDCRVCICCTDAEPVCAQSGEAAVEYNPDNEPVAPGKSGQDDCRDTESKAYPVSINGSTNTGKYGSAECFHQRPYLRRLRKMALHNNSFLCYNISYRNQRNFRFEYEQEG